MYSKNMKKWISKYKYNINTCNIIKLCYETYWWDWAGLSCSGSLSDIGSACALFAFILMVLVVTV